MFKLNLSSKEIFVNIIALIKKNCSRQGKLYWYSFKYLHIYIMSYKPFDDIFYPLTQYPDLYTDAWRHLY